MIEIEVAGGRLTVRGVLDDKAEAGFRDGLRRLLRSDPSAVTVDLVGVEAITSVCVGALVAMWVDLREAGGTLTLRASPAVKKTLDMTGLTSPLMGASPGR